ncbi:winged helix DNA-binding domain-containing protein [Microbulbifer sp. CAU 1566]|uniref:winged helix-turn-helix domain-containing protein n=1 Tax=Microbulbifer sp. CAU 1566 TaxID=2933269 RepID=UPI002004D1AF|nr:crosslink repair DNA glycosylase YcaQ family protein [Microbulbifer sp. CAU 1566]MCK7596626.1 winged helix DNA-binding domain-containing protein [Microbulbifer sp. CAU 1566]
MKAYTKVPPLPADRARALVLARQYVYNPWPDDVGSLIGHLGALQLDSIQVITRAHLHQLHTRLPRLREAGIIRALADAERQRHIFEYWSHAAAYLPVDDYRFARLRMDSIREGQNHWFEKNAKLCRFVLDRIRAEGPLRASDFVRAKGGWWTWSEEKKALEQLFHEGELMVSHREGFQKVFDLPERLLPATVETAAASPAEYGRYLVRTYLRAQGIGRTGEIGYLRKHDKPLVAGAVEEMLASGELAKRGEELVLVEDLECEPPPVPRKVRLLSPFDPLVLQRKRLKRLFDFDYQLECYVPAARRKFGYFCLPILYRDGFAGVVDLKADREAGILWIKALHWCETPKSGLLAGFNKALGDFARYHGLAAEGP